MTNAVLKSSKKDKSHVFVTEIAIVLWPLSSFLNKNIKREGKIKVVLVIQNTFVKNVVTLNKDLDQTGDQHVLKSIV